MNRPGTALDQGVENGGGSATGRLDHLLLLLMVLPNLAWVLLDRGIHAGDPGAHALDAMRVYHALGAGAGEWWRELISLVPKPPMAMWLAHLGAPVGKWLGHFESGLLLPTISAGFVALLLLYKSLRLLFLDRSAALAGCLAVAGAPLFLAYGKGLWMQPLQLLAVCWFLWIMVAAPRLDRLSGMLQLAAAGAFSLLVMVSTPLYCLLPGAIALVRVLRSPWPAGDSWKKRLLLAASAALLVFLLLFWYLRNWDIVAAHARWASRFGYNVSAPDFPAKLQYWLEALSGGAFLIPLQWAAFAALIAAAWIRSGSGRMTGSGWPAAIALLQILLALVVLALADNEEERYALPLLAYVGVLVAWGLRNLKRRWPAGAALVVLGAQFLFIQAGSFGVSPPGYRLAVSQMLQRDGGRLGAVLDGVIEVKPSFPPGKILLATQGLLHCGLMFGALDIQFRETKKTGYDRRQARIYESVEFRLDKTGCDVEEAWRYALSPAIAGAVLIHEEECPPELAGERGYRPLFDAAREFSHRVRQSGKFVRVPLAALPEIEVWRRLNGG